MKVKKEVKIGLFAIVMLLCLYLGINYLKGKDVFSGDRVYYTLYDQTGGLQTSAPVLLRGVKIGTVTNISIDPSKSDQVVVAVNIKKSYRIPTDSSLKLFTNGIMGGKAIELIPGTADSYFERNAVIPSEAETGIFEYATVSIDDVINEFKRIVNSLDATAKTVNSILEQNADSFKGTMENLDSATRQIADAKIGDMLTDLGEFTSVLKNNSGRFDSIIVNLDEVSGSLAEADIKGIAGKLDESIGSLSGILAKIDDGSGSAGRLIEDPALYDSLTTAAGNLAALLANVKENPKRYVHFSVFGGGKDKEKKKNK